MNDFLIVFSSLIILVLAIFLVTNSLKLKKLSTKIEEISMENSKMSFRLFVLEKKQKSYYETKAV